MPRDVSDYKDKNGVTSKSEKTIEFDFTFSRLENWIFVVGEGQRGVGASSALI